MSGYSRKRTEHLLQAPERPTVVDGLDVLPAGQRRVVEVLMTPPAPTYAEVAVRLGIHAGTVSRHLLRVRRAHPDLYREIMATRATQLAARHAAALQRARKHTDKWFYKKRRRERQLSYRLILARLDRLDRLLGHG